jgi:AraC family transcriptional activator of pyochelin receptor
MEQNRSIIDTETLFGGNYSLKDIRGRDSDFETYQEWPSEIGIGHVNMMRLRPGLLLGIGNFRLKEYIEFGFEYTAANSPIFFGYVQSGSLTYALQSEKNIQSMSYSPGHTMVSYLPGGRCVARPQVGVNVRTVGIGIDHRLLQDLVAEDCPQAPNGLCKILNGAERPYCQISNTSPETYVILNQIMTCPYRGALKRLYLEAKALELIACNIAPLTGPASKRDVAFDKSDEDYIRKAELLLKDNLEDPPSLPELARRVGVNKNKLNQGFRKIFGTSVFDHLRILRLERARELLENEHKSVTETAFDVGYAHRENFTRAFKKYFCTSPKDHLC